MPVLDTTALIAADRPDGQIESIVRSRVEAGEDVIVPVQVSIEYCAGRKDPAAGMTALQRSFWIVPCDEDIALEAARIARQAHDEGRFPGWADAQIAATARRLGMPVVTRNAKHFEPLGVRVIAHDG